MNIIKIEMEACENIWSGRKCKKVKKGGKCIYKNKWNKCLKTCGCSCGSCYGADTPIDSKCCNTCDDVKKAYKEKGWTFQPELIQQCEGKCLFEFFFYSCFYINIQDDARKEKV